MYYLIIPASIIAISLIAIFIIVLRKMPYLKKLTLDAHPLGESLWHDMFPEVVSGYRKLHLHDLREVSLGEIEKLLRKIRLMFSRIDRVSTTLIRRVRKEHIESVIENGETESVKPNNQPPNIAEIYLQPKSDRELMESLRLEEQHLIIEIAKNPKNSELYVQLGDIYMKMQNFSDAKESFEAALNLKPEDKNLKKKISSALEKLNMPRV
ncbi:MAG TPA: tetratricopeptide repeat protein [Candidatus Paceibacterota bacterium]|nr:tetratricopeptide repeat protein [Candidatus Paceibacterota bacterium]